MRLSGRASRELLAVADRFRLPGKALGAAPHGRGHIHETFVVTCDDAGRLRRFVLQRLNGRVFPDLDALARNLVRITIHLRARLEREGASDLDRRCLRVVPARDGDALVRDEEGRAWRAFPLVEGARSHDTAASPRQAFEAARAFGAFAVALADLPGAQLTETIPHFHDLDGRAERLERAARADAAGRAHGVVAELDGARRALERVRKCLREAGVADVARRLVHNDCKLNNVLLDDATGEGLCVIDLDTAMEGLLLFDFGDLVRTAACRAPEDELELARVEVDGALLRALAAGYRTGAAAILTAAELSVLPLAGPTLALENAVRFLADHLDGDVYFRIHRAGHNLDRARAQLRLAERMLDGQDVAREALREAAG